jgi:hypothetical protein
MIVAYPHHRDLVRPGAQFVEAQLRGRRGNNRTIIDLIMEMRLPRLWLFIYYRWINKLDPCDFDLYSCRLFLSLRISLLCFSLLLMSIHLP